MASEKAKKTILKFDTEDDVAVALAKYTADLSQRFIQEKGSFNVVLSGGTLIDTMRYYHLINSTMFSFSFLLFF